MNMMNLPRDVKVRSPKYGIGYIISTRPKLGFLYVCFDNPHPKLQNHYDNFEPYNYTRCFEINSKNNPLYHRINTYDDNGISSDMKDYIEVINQDFWVLTKKRGKIISLNRLSSREAAESFIKDLKKIKGITYIIQSNCNLIDYIIENKQI